MIRVNLLPIKEERRRSAGKVQLAIFAVILVVEIGVLAFLYMAKSDEVAQVQEDLQATVADVKAMKKKVGPKKNYEQLKNKLQNKLDVLDQIEQRSTGPVNVLEELQSILSPPAGPEQRHAQSRKDWNVEWNPQNLWVEKLDESGGEFKLTGEALDHDDVAEFLHRLETSSHFKKIELAFVRPTDKSAGDTTIMKFEVTGKLVYSAGENGGTKGS